MFDWLKQRVFEGSTWAGLAAMVVGVGQVAKINEAPMVGDALAQIGTAVGSGASPVAAGLTAVMGVVAVMLRDKGHE